MDTPAAPKDAVADVFARLAEVPIDVVGTCLKNETQQTVAAILLEAPPEWAAALLSGLPHFFRHDVIACMARSRPMHPEARAAVARFLESELLPCRPIPPGRLENVRHIVMLMAPDLRESAAAAVDQAPEKLWVAGPPAPERSAHPFADALPPSTEPLPRVHPVEVERLPLLELIFHRLAVRMSSTLRRLTSENVEVSLNQITSIRNDDYLASLPPKAISAVFASTDGTLQGKLVVDPALMQAVIEPMLGGRSRAIETMRWQARWITTIELNLLALAAASILGDLSAAFSSVMDPVQFRLDRIETDARFAEIAPPTDAMVVARGHLNFVGYGGRWDLIFSHAVLDPMKDLLGTFVPPDIGNQSRAGQGRAA